MLLIYTNWYIYYGKSVQQILFALKYHLLTVPVVTLLFVVLSIIGTDERCVKQYANVIKLNGIRRCTVIIEHI